MLTTLKGIYEDGKVTLIGKPPVQARAEVTVTFSTDEPKPLKSASQECSAAYRKCRMTLMTHSIN